MIHMEQRKQRTKQQALGALISITKKLDDSEVRRVADICQGMVLAKQVKPAVKQVEQKEV